MGCTIDSLIASAANGDDSAANVLLYEKLHTLAKVELSRRGYGVTLGATTLLHEAYLSISAGERTEFPDRARFMAYASRVMRGLIIDYARERRALKRGGQFEITAVATDLPDCADDKALVRIGDALDALSTVCPRPVPLSSHRPLLASRCGIPCARTASAPPGWIAG
jgi:DNA-directed RNA polymerase specialized sigma24 family protein